MEGRNNEADLMEVDVELVVHAQNMRADEIKKNDLNVSKISYAKLDDNGIDVPTDALVGMTKKVAKAMYVGGKYDEYVNVCMPHHGNDSTYPHAYVVHI